MSKRVGAGGEPVLNQPSGQRLTVPAKAQDLFMGAGYWCENFRAHAEDLRGVRLVSLAHEVAAWLHSGTEHHLGR